MPVNLLMVGLLLLLPVVLLDWTMLQDARLQRWRLLRRGLRREFLERHSDRCSRSLPQFRPSILCRTTLSSRSLHAGAHCTQGGERIGRCMTPLTSTLARIVGRYLLPSKSLRTRNTDVRMQNQNGAAIVREGAASDRFCHAAVGRRQVRIAEGMFAPRRCANEIWIRFHVRTVTHSGAEQWMPRAAAESKRARRFCSVGPRPDFGARPAAVAWPSGVRRDPFTYT